jgi:hypothetical protein
VFEDDAAACVAPEEGVGLEGEEVAVVHTEGRIAV